MVQFKNFGLKTIFLQILLLLVIFCCPGNTAGHPRDNDNENQNGTSTTTSPLLDDHYSVQTSSSSSSRWFTNSFQGTSSTGPQRDTNKNLTTTVPLDDYSGHHQPSSSSSRWFTNSFQGTSSAGPRRDENNKNGTSKITESSPSEDNYSGQASSSSSKWIPSYMMRTSEGLRDKNNENGTNVVSPDDYSGQASSSSSKWLTNYFGTKEGQRDNENGILTTPLDDYSGQASSRSSKWFPNYLETKAGPRDNENGTTMIPQDDYSGQASSSRSRWFTNSRRNRPDRNRDLLADSYRFFNLNSHQRRRNSNHRDWRSYDDRRRRRDQSYEDDRSPEVRGNRGKERDERGRSSEEQNSVYNNYDPRNDPRAFDNNPRPNEPRNNFESPNFESPNNFESQNNNNFESQPNYESPNNFDSRTPQRFEDEPNNQRDNFESPDFFGSKVPHQDDSGSGFAMFDPFLVAGPQQQQGPEENDETGSNTQQNQNGGTGDGIYGLVQSFAPINSNFVLLTPGQIESALTTGSVEADPQTAVPEEENWGQTAGVNQPWTSWNGPDMRTPEAEVKTITTSTTTKKPKPKTTKRQTQKPMARRTPKPTVTTTAQTTTSTTQSSPLLLTDAPTFRRGGHLYSSAVQPFSLAQKCDPRRCKLPDCSCGGLTIPGGLDKSQTPQMVLITFDDSVNDINFNFYKELFSRSRMNPNGCPITGTFYVSHQWSDYSQVHDLHSSGHEIASHSISHSDGMSFKIKRWEQEIAGMRTIVSNLANIPPWEIRGMRAPFLQSGGNRMFAMLYDQNFTYDSSLPTEKLSWPYTFDFAISHACSFPGLWEVPLITWSDENGGKCPMADGCRNPHDSGAVYENIKRNFDRHYEGNRAPFGVYFHYAWFTIPHHKEAFLKFVDDALQKDDVYFVTTSQMLEWVRHPTPLSKIQNFKPWACHNRGEKRTSSCNSITCDLYFSGGDMTLKTCDGCPMSYPWINNLDGRTPEKRAKKNN